MGEGWGDRGQGVRAEKNSRDCEVLKDIGILAQSDDGELPELLIYSVETMDTSSLGRK